MSPYQRALWFDGARRVVLEAEQKAPESEAERVVPDEIETPPEPE